MLFFFFFMYINSLIKERAISPKRNPQKNIVIHARASAPLKEKQQIKTFS